MSQLNLNILLCLTLIKGDFVQLYSTSCRNLFQYFAIAMRMRLSWFHNLRDFKSERSEKLTQILIYPT